MLEWCPERWEKKILFFHSNIVINDIFIFKASNGLSYLVALCWDSRKLKTRAEFGNPGTYIFVLWFGHWLWSGHHLRVLPQSGVLSWMDGKIKHFYLVSQSMRRKLYFYEDEIFLSVFSTVTLPLFLCLVSFLSLEPSVFLVISNFCLATNIPYGERTQCLLQAWLGKWEGKEE